MSSCGTPTAITSGVYQGGDEDKAGVGVAKKRRKKEEVAREKLKEELLRQFEAGQLKAVDFPSCQEC